MFVKVLTATLEGVEGNMVTVESDIRRGMPTFTIVGLADTTIKEACSRIKPAILNSGFEFPNEKVTVNLAPAGRPKEGTHFDLPIAVGLVASQWQSNALNDTAFLGELSLDGKLNVIKGALPLVMVLRRAGIKKVVLPIKNAEEAAIIKDVEILAAENLDHVIKHIIGSEQLPIYKGKKLPDADQCGDNNWDIDYSQVIGQETVKRAVVIGAAGGHGILLMGSPGCGKSMIIKRIPTILPRLTYEEMLEITGIYSVAGLLNEQQPIINRRPFRSPHHTISIAGLLGGGAKPRPGEMSLSHGGVLFLDEFGEFDSGVIDAMRQPLEDGVIRLNRHNREVSFPSRVMVVAAANPCKCGHLWDDKKICTCTGHQIDQYMRKLNGPLSDRIDMHIRMFHAEKDIIESDIHRQKAMSSEEMRKQVERAVLIQKDRYRGTKYRNNGDLDEKGMEEYCALDKDCKGVISAAYDKLGLSMRGCSRIIKVARTIADIEESKTIRQEHIAEAVMYRISEEGVK